MEGRTNLLSGRNSGTDAYALPFAPQGKCVLGWLRLLPLTTLVVCFIDRLRQRAKAVLAVMDVM
jgi:hypothetical protein